MEATTTNQGDTKMNGQYKGVTWVKHPHHNIAKGFTTVIVDGEAVRLEGHTSNARAWNFIDKMTKKRGVKVINGTIITKASK
jgi:hypothetical protein